MITFIDLSYSRDSDELVTSRVCAQLALTQPQLSPADWRELACFIIGLQCITSLHWLCRWQEDVNHRPGRLNYDGVLHLMVFTGPSSRTRFYQVGTYYACCLTAGFACRLITGR